LNASHPATGSLLLTELCEFLDQGTDNVDTSSVADIMEFLCITDNSYVASGSCTNRILMELSEELLWWRVVEHLLERLSNVSALPAVTVSRLVVCMLNLLTVVAGNGDVLLIAHECVDESHHLSVFEQQAADEHSELEDCDCKVASKLLEYHLIEMPVVCVRREKSTNFCLQAICKVVDTLRLIVHKTDPVELSDILARGKCQEVVGVTWLHPVVMWKLRQRIFLHSYHELSSDVGDECISDEIISLCGELKSLAGDTDHCVAELTELQKNPQHHFERTLFIIRHRLDGCEGYQNYLYIYTLRAGFNITAANAFSSLHHSKYIVTDPTDRQPGSAELLAHWSDLMSC